MASLWRSSPCQGRGWGEATGQVRQGRAAERGRGAQGSTGEGTAGERQLGGGSGRARLPGALSKRHPAPALRADPLGCGPAVTSNSGWTGPEAQARSGLARAQLPVETPPCGQWKQFTQTQGDSISDAQATPAQSPFHPRIPSKAQIAPSPRTRLPWHLTPPALPTQLGGPRAGCRAG